MSETKQDGKKHFNTKKSSSKPFAKSKTTSFSREKNDFKAKKYGFKNKDKSSKSNFKGKNDNKSQNSKKSFATRFCAYHILYNVLEKQSYLNLAIKNEWGLQKLDEKDRAFVVRLVHSCLENLYKIDYVISKFVEVPEKAGELRTILRLSVTQIMYMDKTAIYGIVNDAVDISKKLIFAANYSGLVNASLKNIHQGLKDISFPKREDDILTYLSIEYSIPKDLINALVEAFGKERAEEIISYRQSENYTCLRPNLMRINKQDFESLLEKKNYKYKKALLDNAYLVKGIDGIDYDEDYKNGLFSVQSQSSMLAVEALNTKTGLNVLDACAAPGGKTCYIAEKQMGTGRVYAWDYYLHRTDLIKQQMYRLQPGNIRVSQTNATRLREELLDYFDRVLLDVPCSNLGVIASKPDVKYKSIEDMSSLLQTQAQILQTCSKYLKIGGRLVYSTCSILPQENDIQIKNFLEHNPNFSVEDIKDCIPESLHQYIDEYGLKLFADKSGLDGFYICALKRNA